MRGKKAKLMRKAVKDVMEVDELMTEYENLSVQPNQHNPLRVANKRVMKKSSSRFVYQRMKPGT